MYLSLAALILGLIAGWCASDLRARMRARDLRIAELEQANAELKQQVRGKRLQYHVAYALDDISGEDAAEEHELVNAVLHSRELEDRLEAIIKANNRRRAVALALRQGRYDPDKPPAMT